MSKKLNGLAVVLVLFVVFAGFVVVPLVSAAPYAKLSTRSLRLGTVRPGATTDYNISFSWPTNTSIGSIRYRLCTDYLVDEPCPSIPPGGDFSGASLATQTGTGGFILDSATTNEILITRNPATMTGTGMHSFTFDDIINATDPQQRFYVQIFTYTSTNGTGTPTHMSSVASAITEPITINGEVPQILYFCAALTITEWCNSVNGNFIDYGDLSDSTGEAAVSQFGVATNALGGYVVTVNGDTMTAGNQTIAALGVPTANLAGVPQFGINLRANIDPANGLDVSGEGIGVVAANYNNPDQFMYQDGDIIASAVTGSMFNTYTVTYIVNIPSNQPSGIYNTTITYICTATF